MAKDVIIHHIHDWSKIDEKEGFWGRIDLLRQMRILVFTNTITISGQVVRLVWDVYLIEMACLYMKMVKSI